MARRVFYSFHYKPDNWRVSQVRNIGAIEDNRAATDNEWETIKRGRDSAIQRWINDQMNGTSSIVLLIGANTANRKWINYEIAKAWNDGKGVLGVHIHNLKDKEQKQSTKGANPFDYIQLSKENTRLSSLVRAYDPPYSTSTYVYDYIRLNLAEWVEEAIRIRNKY